MFEPRYYQADAKWALFDYFRQNPTGNPVVAMPTGTGKSIVIADFIREVFRNWPTQRVMMLTHVKELIEQNAAKVMQVWPTAPLGIYSAGLNSRDMILPIVFGGIQSVANAIKKSIEQPGQTPAHLLHFGWRDLIFVDECHLIGPNEDSAYQYAIGELLKINPYLRIIGLSATPWRLKDGLIIENGIFTDICYDITGVDAFNKLIAEGFICPLIPKSTATEIDISEVKMLGGDYNQSQLENAVDKDEITYAAVKEIVEKGHDRKAWIIFCAGINHVEHVTSMLQSFGIDARAVHSKKPSIENDKNIMDFKNGLARCLVNNGKLTTGFDHPPIDLIGMLRHTMSPGLWVQMLGRGTRPSPATQKENCLVLDFAKNTPRLGPINDPVKPRKAGKGTGDAPVKICDTCGAYNHAGARFCCSCNEPFSFTSKLFTTAGTDVLIKSDLPQIEFYKVDKIIYNLHEKKDKQSGQLLAPPSIKVSYFSGLRMFNEWVCLEHSGLPGKKARDWWRQRHNEEPPATTWQALQKVKELRTPTQIKVWVNKKYPEILNAEW